MALYTETVMDHFTHPRNVGEIPDADGVGEVGNAKCGDIMKMYLKIKDDRIRIKVAEDVEIWIRRAAVGTVITTELQKAAKEEKSEAKAEEKVEETKADAAEEAKETAASEASK